MRIAGTYSRTARKLEKLEHPREGVAFHVPPIRRPPGTPADRTGQRLREYAGTCIDPLGLIKPDLQGAGHSSTRKSGFFVLIGRDQSAQV